MKEKNIGMEIKNRRIDSIYLEYKMDLREDILSTRKPANY
jgi:hypothetical protein